MKTRMTESTQSRCVDCLFFRLLTHPAAGTARERQRLDSVAYRSHESAISRVRPKHAAERRRLSEVRQGGLRLVVELSRQKVLLGAQRRKAFFLSFLREAIVFPGVSLSPPRWRESRHVPLLS